MWYFDLLCKDTVRFNNGRAAISLAGIIEETVGELIVTNIPERYNGSYMHVITANGQIVGCDKIISSSIRNASLIQNGTAILKVWRMSDWNRHQRNYDGTESVEAWIYIRSDQEYLARHQNDAAWTNNIIFNFTNGKATYSLEGRRPSFQAR